MAGASTMAWGLHRGLLLLVVASLGRGQRPRLQHSYDCGVWGMQLLVFPGPNQTIHFKVLDEFGNRFEVNNCSICYHWVSSEPHKPAVLSADYKGCHVLEKDGRFHLRVSVQAKLPGDHAVVAQDVTLICPKPDHIWTQEPHLTPPTTSSPAALPTLALDLTPNHLLPGSGHTVPGTVSSEHGSIHPSPVSPFPDSVSPFPDSVSPFPDSVSPFPDSVSPFPDSVSPFPDSVSPFPADPVSPSPDPVSPSPDPVSPSPDPELSSPNLPNPQWGILENWQVAEPGSVDTRLPREQCQAASGHIPCLVKSPSKEACQQAGCCYDNTSTVPCYYGNTATIQCFRSGYFILVLSRETALAHRITLGNVYLAYAPTRCRPTRETSAFVVFHVPLTLCGTTVQVVGDRLVYENQLVSDIDVQKGPQGSITRDSTFRLHVRCIFNAEDFLPIQASVFPSLPPDPVTQPGPLRLELRIAKDEHFSSYYQEKDYPLVRLLREPVHVEVRLLQRTDPSLGLRLHQCWAAPSASPFEQPQWPILSDGCPFEGDSYRTQMVAVDSTELPFHSHYQRFAVATFSLLDLNSQRALRGLVYFFCSASVCHTTEPETCFPACGSGLLRRRRRSSGHHNVTARPLDIVSSPGAVGFEESAEQGPSGSKQDAGRRPLLWVLLLLMTLTLVLGAGIFVGLTWARVQKPREGTAR